MTCIAKLLELKGDKDFILSPKNKDVAIEGGGSYKGYDYLITLNDFGIRCGYVAIPKTHGLYNSDEDYPDYCVHGGVTFFGEPHLIESDCGDKWIGFDAAHAYDAHDLKKIEQYFGEQNESFRFMMSRDYYTACNDPVRDFDYMETECRNLIDQLIA